VVADVSGNGIAAALLMTSFRALLIPAARDGKPPEQLLAQINTLLPEFARKRDFVTALYGVLDIPTGTFTYANCGQNLPFVVRADGRIERLTQSGPSLLIIPDALYRTGTARLEEGDLLVLYTDGVVEVFSGDQQQFGNERLEQVARRSRQLTADAILREIVAATRTFSGPEVQHDDSTLVVVKREFRSPAPGRS
jgi:sigma-B regulation protein RsbU (phosphoserine phosphatase)